MKQNIITLKIKYTSEENNFILSCIKDYNKILKFTYNRIIKEDITSTKELTTKQKLLNNTFLDSHFKNSATIEAKGIVDTKQKSICFGHKAYKQYCKGKITKEELDTQKLVPIYSVGESSQKANRKFRIINSTEIVFQPNREKHIKLTLTNYKHYNKHLTKLKELQDICAIPITYKLDLQYVYISFDLNKVYPPKEYKSVKNRIMAIDLNPNYIGYSIVDWENEDKYRIVTTGVYDIKEINDYENSLKSKKLSSSSKERKYINNKRQYETSIVGKDLVNLAKHCKCEMFVIEDLKIQPKDSKKGKSYNRLVINQWCRDKLFNKIRKDCLLNNIIFQEIMPNYSSFIGNLVYRNENKPDMILASIEINRRGYEFLNQHIHKTKDKKKNIVVPELHVVKDRIDHALEVLGYSEMYENLIELYKSLKKTKLKYRVSLDNCVYSSLFRLNNRKSNVNHYIF